MAEVQLKSLEIKPLVCVSFLCQLCNHFTLLLVKLPHFPLISAAAVHRLTEECGYIGIASKATAT